MPADIDSGATALIKSCLPPCLWISGCAGPAGPLLEPWITHVPASSPLPAFQSRFSCSQPIHGAGREQPCSLLLPLLGCDSAQWLGEKLRKERKNLFSIVLANWTDSWCAFAGLKGGGGEDPELGQGHPTASAPHPQGLGTTQNRWQGMEGTRRLRVPNVTRILFYWSIFTVSKWINFVHVCISSYYTLWCNDTLWFSWRLWCCSCSSKTNQRTAWSWK